MNSQLKGRPRRGAAWSSAPAPSATPTVGDTSSPATVGRRVPLETNVADPHGRPRFDGDRCPLSRRGPACGPRPGYRSALARCSHGSSGGGRREIHPRGRAFDPGCSCDLLLGLAELIRQLTARLDRDPTGETNAPRRAASSVPQSWQPAPPLRLSHESIACSLIASISGARGPSTSHRRRPAAHLGRRRVRAYHQPRSQEPGPKVRRSTGSGSPSPLPERCAPRVPGAGTTPVVPPSAADAWGDARRDWSSRAPQRQAGLGKERGAPQRQAGLGKERGTQVLRGSRSPGSRSTSASTARAFETLTSRSTSRLGRAADWGGTAALLAPDASTVPSQDLAPPAALDAGEFVNVSRRTSRRAAGAAAEMVSEVQDDQGSATLGRPKGAPQPGTASPPADHRSRGRRDLELR